MFKSGNFNKYILLLFLFVITSVTASAQIKIKSLRYYPYSQETSLAVITPETDGLVINFDIDSQNVPDLKIIFRFCDRNWHPMDNVFLSNYGQNISLNLDFSNLPATIQKAKYHYDGIFPDPKGYVSFPFSGKYMFFVTDALDSTIVYATGQFIVVHPDIKLNVALKKELLEDKTYYPVELGRIFNITAKFDLPDNLFPGNVNSMEIVENQKMLYPYLVDRSYNSNTRQFYWNGNKSFSFTIRDIMPGNEYRQTDLRNTGKFISENVKAQFDGMEYPRFDKFGGRDLNGGQTLTDYNNEYANYMKVTFSFRPYDNFYGNIYLTGAFNNWQILPEYEMTNSGGYYTKTIELKRGIYDYQYVSADYINNQIKNENWIQLEGNFWETENVYHVFIFYQDPNYGGFDRIIGYQKLISK